MPEEQAIAYDVQDASSGSPGNRPSAPETAHLPESISFGREICGHLPEAEAREWLITNGIGGYASGTIAGLLTRRYHGILVAALNPPLGRTLLAAKFDETAEYGEGSYPLSTDRWAGGTLTGMGHLNIEEFRLEGTTPVWTYAFADALLEKQIFMRQGENTTYVLYTVRRASGPVRLHIKSFVNYRDYHGNTTAGNWHMQIEPVDNGIRVTPFEGARRFSLLSDRAGMSVSHEWYHNFDLAAERSRGLCDREDHLLAGTFEITLRAGESCTLAATTEKGIDLGGESALEARHEYERSLLSRSRATGPEPVPPSWIDQTILAADQFIVTRPGGQGAEGTSIIAGYHWFGDWGRDTMISLPGLALATGRPELARSILLTFSRFVDKGMLPNRFPDAGEQPEYNTVDATLWYVEAVRACYELTKDTELLADLFPVLEDIIAWHEKGTRYGIHVDPADGLLFAGEAGVQLTWMDAKIGDWVVTPRIGKPVEINALWFNALSIMQSIARILDKPYKRYELLALRAAAGFRRFWNEDLGCCYDVIDGPGGLDSSLRPNQIIAVSLPATPLLESQQRRIVEVCGRRLLTSFGLRSLAVDDPSYAGHYGGDQFHRDSAYHQGTVWGWLLGPFALAHYRVYQDRSLAQSFLEPMAQHLKAHGLGTMSEVFDGDPPFTPGGCIAQAWTVGEILRAWMTLTPTPPDQPSGTRPRASS
jgi:predicted glycogen debranching enzyme